MSGPVVDGASGRSWGRWLVLGVVLLLGVLGARSLDLAARLQSAQTWIASLGAWGAVAFVGLYVLTCVFALPGAVVTMAAGALFGLAKGVVVVFVGAMAGSTACFVITRYLARGLVERRLAQNEKFRALDAAMGREGLKIMALMRLSPLFPFNFLNYSLGLTAVKLSDYVLAGFAMIPGTFLYVYYGVAAGSLAEVTSGGAQQAGQAWHEQLFFYVGLAATFAVTWVIARVAKQALQSATGLGTAMTRARARAGVMIEEERFGKVLPDEQCNRDLCEQLHPAGHVNPEPAGRYNLVVIGAGPAGLVAAAGAAGLGARVALIERHLMGGDCLNAGCVPSKSLLRAAKAVHQARQVTAFGGKGSTDVAVDFGAVMSRLWQIRSSLAEHDSVKRFQGLGVDVFLGSGRFTGPDRIAVGDRELIFANALIATGARAALPSVAGLEEAGFLTNETVFELTALPATLAIIGGGPIGCEMAQAFCRLGSEVHLFHRGTHVLDREDGDAAEVVQQALVEDGVVLHLGCSPERARCAAEGKEVAWQEEGEERSLVASDILVAAGRAANVEGLGLEQAGVAFSSGQGVRVDEHLRTSNPRVFAAGDVCMKWKFTHAADAAARIVIQNALFAGKKRLADLVVPWVTYTDPEIAHVGLTASQALARGVELDTYMVPMSDIDRAVCDSETAGFAKVHVRKGTDKILGATLVGAHAGEMIGEVCLAMTSGLGLGRIASTLHPYPTQAEVIKRLGDAYNRTRLTPLAAKLLNRWLAWTR